MLPEDQKRILGYFIEEAKDHLNTIEQGLLNLQATIEDPEMVNEVFRAAHSVKGGAAMLGLDSIQHTSHRLEDYFKVLKESPIQADRTLESMLLQIFDGLQEQLEQLQGPFGLTDDRAQEILSTLEPILGQVDQHLDTLVKTSGGVAAAAKSASQPPAPKVPVGVAQPSGGVPHPETSALQLVFKSDVPALLRTMLGLFKQADNAATRQEIQEICQQLYRIGEQFELAAWCTLIETARQVVGNEQQSFRVLAPLFIKEIKAAQDCVLTDRANQIRATEALHSLLPPLPVHDLLMDESLDALLEEALNEGAEEDTSLADLFETVEAAQSRELELSPHADWLEAMAPATRPGTERDLADVLQGLDADAGTSSDRDDTLPLATGIGPEVGLAELNSLADLFEGEVAELDSVWEEEITDIALDDLDSEVLDATMPEEFADFLLNEADAATPEFPEPSADDDFANLFGGAFLDEGQVDQPSTADVPAAPWGGPSPADIETLLASPAETPVDTGPEVFDEIASAPRTGTQNALEIFFDTPDVDVPAVQGAAQSPELEDFFGELSATERPTSSLESPLPEPLPGQRSDRPATFLDELDLAADLWGETAPPPATQNLQGFPAPEQAGGWREEIDQQSIDRDLGMVPELEAEEARSQNISLANLDLDSPGQAELADVFGLTEMVLEELPETTDSGGVTPETPPLTDRPFSGMGPSTVGFPKPHGPSPVLNIEDASFADLEALLGDEFPGDALPGDEFPGDEFPTAAQTPDLTAGLERESPSARDVLEEGSAIEMETGEPLTVIQDDQMEPFLESEFEEKDEFEDLEKLLEEADQLGVSSPAAGRRAQAAARRMPRRSNMVADQTMRVSVKHLDNLSNLVGELVVNRNSLEQDQERLRQFLDNLLFQVQQLNDVGQRMRDLYERSLLESSLISSRKAFQSTGISSMGEGAGNSHATGVTFDALEMDRFTGFHTLSQEMIELIVRVRESSSDIAFTIESTDQITRQFRQVTTQLQEGLNKARMVPFAQTADRLPRAVRDISLKCGKEAKLIVEGRDTLIDKMILERLYDPMTHLVNNAITHGIETPEERAIAGKPREGTITVRAFYQGNQTVIYIADDGAGINAEFVKQKALKRGLITPTEARTMTKLDVYELLFLPGFSTRDQADDFAGRGIGMDVVRTALAEIRGSVTIDSEMGKGTSFTIRLPLTLSISKALSCVNNQARIAFPMDGVEDMFDAPSERIQMNDQGQTCILWRDTLLPFRPLADLLQFNRTIGRGRVYGGHHDDDIISIVVLRSANTYIALQVDQVIGEQEIVIKQLEGPVPKPMGIAGATVLGDGRVMPIADVLELIDLSLGRVRRDPNLSLWSQVEDTVPPMEEVPVQTEPTVLIVDDSITVRELLSMSFNKVGYRVEQARDGQEAWEKLRSGLPCDLVFCDIEMPRMDGLELLSRMQKDHALSHVPIAMLTSRGADRHRQMAIDLGAKGYFTKPYLEEVLLDAAQRMLNGESMVTSRNSQA